MGQISRRRFRPIGCEQVSRAWAYALRNIPGNRQLRRCVLKRAWAVCSIAWIVVWPAFVSAADLKKLTVRLLDGQPISARVSVVGSDGKPYAPAGSILRQPEGTTPYFYADGKFVVT